MVEVWMRLYGGRFPIDCELSGNATFCITSTVAKGLKYLFPVSCLPFSGFPSAIESSNVLVYVAFMKNTTPEKCYLVVRPPGASLAQSGLLMPAVVSSFGAAGIKAEAWDAASDFFQYVLLNEIGEDSLSHLWDHLTTDRFFELKEWIAFRKRVDSALFAFSQQHYPFRMRWDSLYMKDAEKDILSDDHPLTLFFQNRFDAQIKSLQPSGIVFCVADVSQLAAAMSMAMYMIKHHPLLERLVVSRDPGACRDIAEHSTYPPIQFTLSAMADFIARRCNSQIDSDRLFNDINSFSMSGGCLTPKHVLSVDMAFWARTGNFNAWFDQLSKTKTSNGVILCNPGDVFEPPVLPVRQVHFSNRFFDPDNFDPVNFDIGKGGGLGRGQSIAAIADRGLKLVEWIVTNQDVQGVSKSLWNISKKGIWNHVHLTSRLDPDIKEQWCRFISSNPNIVHSYSCFDPAAPYGQAIASQIDERWAAYSQVAPLPGIPLWQLLAHPDYISFFLDHYTKDELVRMRTDERSGQIIKTGDNIIFNYKKPADLPDGVLDEICRMVAAGGSVGTTHVRHNLERAFLIAYAQENGVIVGNSSLKHPRDEFVGRLNKVSGLDFTDFVERGYTSVRPEYRALGVGAKLLEGLTNRAGDRKVFSIITEDNIATQKIAIKNRTRKIITYYSDKIGKQAGIWMPEHMIEGHWDIEKWK